MDDENLFEKIDALFEADMAHWDTPHGYGLVIAAQSMFVVYCAIPQ